LPRHDVTALAIINLAMSSFWNLFGKAEKPPGEEGESADAAAGSTAATPGAPAKPSTAPKPGGGGGQPQGSVAPKQPPAALEGGKPPPPVLPPARTTPRYGIDEAIRLMRTLPVDDNPDLVVRVIKRTLESLSVKVPEIIEDAAKRQESLRAKISEHQAAIVQLEREIDARRFDIGRLEDELSETTQVRERLQLAEQLPITPNAPRVGSPTQTQSQSQSLSQTGSSVITGSNPPPPSAQKKPPLPNTVFRPKPTGDLKRTTPETPNANKEAAAAFPAPVPAATAAATAPPTKDEKKEEKKDESSPGAPKADASPKAETATSRDSKSDDDDDDDDDEPVESRDMIDKS
jgi:hypothetical protein